MLEERLQCVTAEEHEEQWKQMKTILQENTAEVVDLLTRIYQDWFDKQIRKPKSFSKTTLLPQSSDCKNLMIKLPRLHTGLPAVHYRLS